MAQKNKLCVTLSTRFCFVNAVAVAAVVVVAAAAVVFYSVSCIFIVTKLRLINRCIGLAYSRGFQRIKMRV